MKSITMQRTTTNMILFYAFWINYFYVSMNHMFPVVVESFPIVGFGSRPSSSVLLRNQENVVLYEQQQQQHSTRRQQSSSFILKSTFFRIRSNNNILLQSTKLTDNNENSENSSLNIVKDNTEIEEGMMMMIQHPVLLKLIPSMMKYIEQYGHPNIPLPDGKGLETIRRLYNQNKLTEKEIQFLNTIQFRFHTFDNIYDSIDFYEMYDKLIQYRNDNDGDVSPPKKYPIDPELGAWVTSIRRKGMNQMKDPEHVRLLNDIEFQWTSKRQCGSTFMIQYRELVQKKENLVILLLQQQQQEGKDELRSCKNEKKDNNMEQFFVEQIVSTNDTTTMNWIRAMQKKAIHHELSLTRQHYMETLFGSNWITNTKFLNN